MQHTALHNEDTGETGADTAETTEIQSTLTVINPSKKILKIFMSTFNLDRKTKQKIASPL